MKLRQSSGFALVITLVLLALLVLAVFALSALTKVGSEVSAASQFQTQARQNAQLALNVALGELQRHAGDDTRITGMAGIAGVPSNTTATTRFWCGVWRNDGGFVKWLASGAETSSTSLTANLVELISTGSVGAANSSTNADRQHVIAGKVHIVAPTSSSTTTPIGSYAYLVVDEGIKVSAYAPAGERAIPDAYPAMGSWPSMLNSQTQLKTALDSYALKLPGIISFEQLVLLPGDDPLPAGAIRDTFHFIGLTPRSIVAGQNRSGMININTSSTLTWRSVLASYNAMVGVNQVVNVSTKGDQIGTDFAAATAGKAANGPFTSTLGFTTYLATIFPITNTPNYVQIMTALGPMLTTRSDTFRIRAYGEALNPLDSTKIEASAYCEAIVQRTPDPLPGFGRRFVITYFRWLGPEDI